MFFKSSVRSRSLITLCLFCVLFILPSFFWVIRNYFVSGYFPIISTIRGETFWGGNNPTSANDLSKWGYWVFPDEISGEKLKKELSQKYNQVELDRYYNNKGVEYLKNNILSVPRLVLGKVIRAYVPIPWVPSLESFVAFGYRFVCYLLVVLLVAKWKNLNSEYNLILGVMFITSFVTTISFYGAARLTFPFELFFMIPAGVLFLKRSRE